MRKNNNRAFTIIELVIVIAVIAILAAVLIPSFVGLVAKANENAAMQEARNEYELFIAENVTNSENDRNLDIVVTKGSDVYVFTVENGQFNTVAIKNNDYSTIGKIDLTADKYDATTDDEPKSAKTYYIKNGTEYNEVAGLIAFDAETVYYEKTAGIPGNNVNVAIYRK